MINDMRKFRKVGLYNVCVCTCTPVATAKLINMLPFPAFERQESLANAKVGARQLCVCECP